MIDRKLYVATRGRNVYFEGTRDEFSAQWSTYICMHTYHIFQMDTYDVCMYLSTRNRYSVHVPNSQSADSPICKFPSSFHIPQIGTSFRPILLHYSLSRHDRFRLHRNRWIPLDMPGQWGAWCHEGTGRTSVPVLSLFRHLLDRWDARESIADHS